jgi:tetratricopeptide (TPR) repeat protein
LEPHVVAEVIGEIAEILVENGRPEEALERLAQCPESGYHEAFFLTLKADCMWQLGRAQEAVSLVDRALALDSTLAPALRLRASIYQAQERPDLAQPLLLRYKRIDPISLQARKLLSHNYGLLQLDEKAREEMNVYNRLYAFNQKMIDLNTDLISNPQSDALRVQIGNLWLTVNEFLQARAWFRSALDVNPNNREAKQALVRLDPASAAQALPAGDRK